MRSLQRRLVDIGKEAEAYAPPEEQTILPTSFADLLSHLDELSRVEYTGDVDCPLGLDEFPQSSSWAQTAWQAELNASGRVFMGAHIRLGGGAGMSAPRMHYFDAVGGSGMIYIGYLGPHLKVKSTN